MNDVLVSDPQDRVPRLGERTRRRPQPGFGHVLGAAAGAFAVVAVVAFVVEVAGSDPTAPGVGFDAGLAVLALLVGFRAPGPLRSAGVTILVLTVPITWFFALFGGGNAGRGELRGVYLLTIGTYLVLYLVGWTRGRAILLAGALLILASWIAFEVAGNNASVVPFQDQVSTPFSVSGSSSSGSGTTTFNDNGTLTIDGSTTSSGDDTSIAAVVTGLAFLGIGALLDHRRLAGVATPFIAVGAIEAISGAVGIGGTKGPLGGGLLAAAVGVVVGVVGAHGRDRRGSTWIGVLTIFGGLVAVLVDIGPSSAAGIGGIALGFAVGLGLIAVWIAPWLGETDDGGTPRRGEPVLAPAPAIAAPATAAGPGPAAGATAEPASATTTADTTTDDDAGPPTDTSDPPTDDTSEPPPV